VLMAMTPRVGCQTILEAPLEKERRR